MIIQLPPKLTELLAQHERSKNDILQGFLASRDEPLPIGRWSFSPDFTSLVRQEESDAAPIA